MNIIYMGTPGFAVPALKRLAGSRHQVSAVVCQPDRPVGRGQKMHMPAVKEEALAHNLIVLQPEKIKNCAFDQVLKTYNPDIIVVVAYGKIIPPEILKLPKYGCLNIHASLLPKYRGAAPIQWAIIRGETKTGVTIMQLDEGLDTGPIIATEEIEILTDDDTLSVSNMLSVLGAELLMKVLDAIETTGEVIAEPQDDSRSTLAPLLQKKDGLLDWTESTESLICRIHGLHPWPGAFSFLSGKPWKFLKAEPFDDSTKLNFRTADKMERGAVTGLIKGLGFTVRTGSGHLLVTSFQAPGKKAMDGADAVNGNLVKVGDLFISDPAFLEGE
ncbi:MAG: methionyl-tRNA formyltransferase [Candidatus Sumerlaeaceae bacterium]|nr:methionyl-tRNA formyltransferase [Candidatus Sumerlaeaceae bacterium]